MCLQRTIALLLLVVMIVTLAGCRSKTEGTGRQGGPDVRLVLEPDPPVVGEARLVFIVSDRGQPVSNLQVSVEGNMTHAGMQPVFATAVETDPGRYVTQDFRFTMNGDWVLTVTLRSSEGSTFTRTFEVTVGE
ncbi:FixH family protein [Thermaerobacter subterraneus]|uniref:YtkA-like domain-containing protein n=1 Tax=Thermaerobacter subterraneus DSM 13965 TaxID=867903 RepID=K6QF95_9FIRM|nr:FixH family protein [Thermaerobacter subterraneus]EKP95646.1 hypothetical protein ThesuDRAFT_01403 [Thermaerobacter subterraneus DSM 13965]